MTESNQTEVLLLKQNTYLRALQETTLDLASQLDLDVLLENIVRRAAELVGTSSGYLDLIDLKTGQLVPRVGLGAGVESLNFPVRPGEGVAGAVWQTGLPLTVEDYDAWPGRIPEFSRGTIRTIVAVPLLAKAQVLGVLGVAYERNAQQAFEPDDLGILVQFARFATIAIRNAGLYAESQRRARQLAALHKAGQAIVATLEREKVAHLVTAETREALGAEAVAVLLCDFSSRELVIAAVAGPSKEQPAGARMRLDRGIAGWVVREKRPVLIHEACDDPRFDGDVDACSGLPAQALIAAPLVVADRVIGVLEALSKPEGFAEDDLNLLTLMAGAAAIAIENARLYELAHEQYRCLQSSQAQLVQAEKLSALGRLTASIMHEINNPLQAIYNYLALVQESLSRDARGADPDLDWLTDNLCNLSIAMEEVMRISGIVYRVRGFYRPARTERRAVDLHALLDSVLALLHKQLQHSNIRVERDWAHELPAVKGNADHLKQVFLNVILNAIDAMPSGGVLTVHTCADVTGAAPAVCIEIGDTGTGMAPDVLARAFEPLFTTREHGSGLGLSISYEIVRAHDGRMTATSQVGAGTTVAIMLPAEASL